MRKALVIALLTLTLSACATTAPPSVSRTSTPSRTTAPATTSRPPSASATPSASSASPAASWDKPPAGYTNAYL
ncbi:MAG: hypothetical protein HY829_09090, partial [Actinobacteria bacterium]|nr:hypothetical protein [Actinomycetota bacterium]